MDTETPRPGGRPDGANHPHDDEPNDVDLRVMDELDDSWFWRSRPALRHINVAARARRTGPYGVLGVVLLRVLACTSHEVTLPPLIGGPASLNSAGALLGTSGLGKGASDAVGRELLPGTADLYETEVASGEALSHAFTARQKDGSWARVRYAALINFAEIDSAAGASARPGSTLSAAMRKAWSGEPLGALTADTSRRAEVERHSYRACLALAVQDGRAGWLLDQAPGGLPQRFAWFSTTDFHVPSQRPAWPGPLPWRPRGHRPGPLEVDERVAATIDDDRVQRLRGIGAADEGHMMLVCLKLAAGLGVLDGRHEVTWSDWLLAQHLMEHGAEARARARRVLEDTAVREAATRGELDGVRRAVADEERADVLRRRTWQRIWEICDRPKGATYADLSRDVSRPQREYLDDVLMGMIEEGTVQAHETERGRRFTLR